MDRVQDHINWFEQCITGAGEFIAFIAKHGDDSMVDDLLEFIDNLYTSTAEHFYRHGLEDGKKGENENALQ